MLEPGTAPPDVEFEPPGHLQILFEVAEEPGGERSRLIDQIARARLEREGGYQRVERGERDLERARQRLREVAW